MTSEPVHSFEYSVYTVLRKTRVSLFEFDTAAGDPLSPLERAKLPTARDFATNGLRAASRSNVTASRSKRTGAWTQGTEEETAGRVWR